MIRVRPAAERGRTEWGWLDSRHTFSFGEYYDAKHEGFRTLRVINDDRVRPGAGFGTHGHRDMEILSYVLEGALEHKDSAGGGGVIRPGEIQFMRAGTGVTHSEFNHSKVEPVHFLQVWIVPDQRGLKPAYGQLALDQEAAARSFVLLASRDERQGSIQVHQDVDLWVSFIGAGQRRDVRLRPGRHAWIHVARGSVSVNGTALGEGDGAAVSGEGTLQFGGETSAEVLMFDLA
ncbi:MAG: quercetin 2,3-dioxygenase [Acidobacteria bacterium]|nr:MAG: quercetin 2,3-dioxygenase [Acidobacteriota bacterium]